MTEHLRFLILRWALRRYCERYMDQWEMWRFGTEYGDVFVKITRQPSGPKEIVADYGDIG